ncbi:MAG: metalloregulator ArsR/SmtB family transcription factor, partial [Parvularculales bacterium]
GHTKLQGVLRALSNRHRLTILTWLLAPEEHFQPQAEADLVEDGVCVCFMTEKIGLSQPTVTVHLQTLAKADLLTSKKMKNWVYYKPNRKEVARFLKDIGGKLNPS